MEIKCKECKRGFDFKENFQKESEEKINQDEYGKKCIVEGTIICPHCAETEDGTYSYYDETGSGKMDGTEELEFNNFKIV